MIGPKCQLCGKQPIHHEHKTQRCPVGKRMGGQYIFFHEQNKFQPREKAKGGHSEKRKKTKGTRRRVKTGSSKETFKEIRAEGCCACGSHLNVEIHHVLRRSQGGSNHRNNLLPLCSADHTQEPWAWHRDRNKFFGRFPHVWERLMKQNWQRGSVHGWKLLPPPEAHGWWLRQEAERCTA